MLKKQNRFQLRRITNFFFQAKRVSTPYWIMWLLPKTGTSQGVVIVPKKHFSLATQRNRQKRILREALSPILNEARGYYVVVTGKKDLEKLSVAEIHQALKKSFSKRTS